MTNQRIPSISELEPVLIEILTGAEFPMTNLEILKTAKLRLDLTEEALKTIHDGNRTELEYRLAWARSRSKKKNLIRRVGNQKWELNK
jgi:hypothetical protein